MSLTDPERRRALQLGLAATTLFLPIPWATLWAQSEGTLKLIRLPKIALVLGNSKYKDAPLKNPANDAKAFGEALVASGFSVVTRLDAGRTEMSSAIDAYVRELAAKKCVGLFYYAGHGVQLAWRNYMLPVDAEVDTIDDVQKRAVEVNQLMEGLAKAGNPLNVVILDACRDNPFGSAKQPQQKGLSQMDAPNHTLLAYATSPGNVASDGEGANGLYTENLLREMKVPDAKLEDVFKRVRLGVRRKSSGAQVPWESTSLEDDFWFQPPKEMKKLSEVEREHQYREESVFFEKIKASSDLAQLEAYLMQYPSGNFNELVQLQLDRVLAKQGEKRIHVTSQAGNPYTKGTVETSTLYKVGDTYTYQVDDLASKASKGRRTDTVTRVTETEVVYDSGLITDLLGNTQRFPDGLRSSGNQNVPVEFAIGRKWISRATLTRPDGGTLNAEGENRIAVRESITVPAGTFDAFRIEGRGKAVGRDASVDIHAKEWWAPDKVRRMIAREIVRDIHSFAANRKSAFTERWALVSYKEG